MIDLKGRMRNDTVLIYKAIKGALCHVSLPICRSCLLICRLRSDLRRRRRRGLSAWNLLYAADLADQAGVDILIEPINPMDMPGYLLNSVEQAAVILKQLDHPRLALQFDIYHAQIVGGNIAARLDQYLEITRHVQVAGAPGRHEPDSGELN